MFDRIVLNVKYSDVAALDGVESIERFMDIGELLVGHGGTERYSLVRTLNPVFDRDSMTVTCEVAGQFEKLAEIEGLTLLELNDTESLSFQVFASFCDGAHPAWHFGTGEVYLQGVEQPYRLRTDDVEYERETARRILARISDPWLVKRPKLYSVTEMDAEGFREVNYLDSSMAIDDAILSCLNSVGESSIVCVFGRDREGLLSELR